MFDTDDCGALGRWALCNFVSSGEEVCGRYYDNIGIRRCSRLRALNKYKKDRVNWPRDVLSGEKTMPQHHIA